MNKRIVKKSKTRAPKQKALPKELKPEKFKVFIRDRFHFFDDEDAAPVWECNTYAEALRRCEEIVESYLADIVRLDKNISLNELIKQYTTFGADPWITPAIPGKIFNGVEYARVHAGEMIAQNCDDKKKKTAVLLPSHACLFCGRKLAEVGGSMLVGQNNTWICLNDKKSGVEYSDYPVKSIRLRGESGIFIEIKAHKERLTPYLMEQAKKEFEALRHPWFCQICADRLCILCGSPTQLLIDADLLCQDGTVIHYGNLGVKPGCINEKCKNHISIIKPTTLVD